MHGRQAQIWERQKMGTKPNLIPRPISKPLVTYSIGIVLTLMSTETKKNTLKAINNTFFSICHCIMTIGFAMIHDHRTTICGFSWHARFAVIHC